jgi:hypothetical protein
MLKLYGVWTAKKWNAMIRLIKPNKDVILYLTPGTVIDFSGKEK